VAAQAERADVVEVAFASTFNHGNDVVRIPEAATPALPDRPVLQLCLTAGAAGTPELPKRGYGVHMTQGAEAAVAQEHLFTQVSRLRAQLPLMNAVCRAEAKAAARNLERTPAAQTPIVGTTRNCFAIDPAPAHGAHRTHLFFCKCPRAQTAANLAGREAESITNRPWHSSPEQIQPMDAAELVFGGAEPKDETAPGVEMENAFRTPAPAVRSLWRASGRRQSAQSRQRGKQNPAHEPD